MAENLRWTLTLGSDNKECDEILMKNNCICFDEKYCFEKKKNLAIL